MARTILPISLFLLAGPLLVGGCTQTSVVPQRQATFSLAPEKSPTTLPAGLREGIALQVRFITVSDDLVNTLPVKWDQSLRGSLRQIAGTPDNIAQHPESVPVTMKAGTIDDAGTARVLARIMGDPRSVMVAAPSVVALSGQPAKLAVGQEQNYVKDVHQDTAQVAGHIAATSTQYNIQTLHTGIDMDMTATFDRDNAILAQLHPTISRLEGIDTYSMKPGTDGPFVQLPRISLTDFSTSASIPGGGTLLIVGPKIFCEVEVETGVPILSQIPGLGRLFTNRAYIKGEQTLLLIVRPSKITASAPAAQNPASPATDSAELRKARVAALVAVAHKLYDSQQFREAQDLLRQAAIIDPQDQDAALFLKVVSTKIIDRDHETIMHRAGTEVMRQNIDSGEHLIPYGDLVVYPDNWPGTTRRREASTQSNPARE